MLLNRKTFISASLMVCLGLAGLSGAQVTPSAPAAPPTQLAVINIVALFDGLHEKTDGEQEIDGMRKQFETERTKKQSIIDDLNKNMGAFKVGTAEFKDVQKKLLLATMDFQSFSNYAQQSLLIELVARKKLLYKEMNEALAKYCQARGIALVFVADSGNTDGIDDPNQLTEMIQMRKVLYYNPAYDITLAVQEAMNTDYELAKKH